jgi:hypothetical protein
MPAGGRLTKAALTVSLYSGACRRRDSSASQPARLMIDGRVVIAVASPGRGGSIPGVAVMSGVTRWAASPLPAAVGRSTRIRSSVVPASSQTPGAPTPVLVRLYDRLVVPAERLLERRVQPRFGQSILCVVRVPDAAADGRERST